MLRVCAEAITPRARADLIPLRQTSHYGRDRFSRWVGSAEAGCVFRLWVVRGSVILRKFQMGRIRMIDGFRLHAYSDVYSVSIGDNIKKLN